MDKNKLDIGNKFTKTLGGGQYEEIKMLRRMIWANIIFKDSQATQEQLDQANQYKADFLAYHDKVEIFIKNN